MTAQPAPSLSPSMVLPPPPPAKLPLIWEQLDAAQRRQLVQTLAELIRRIQLAPLPPKEVSHDHA
jgi:hypothetical protein